MFFRKTYELENDTTYSDDSGSFTSGETSTFFSPSFMTGAESECSAAATAVMTTQNAACMRLEDMLFADEDDTFVSSTSNSKKNVSKVSSPPQQRNRRFVKLKEEERDDSVTDGGLQSFGSIETFSNAGGCTGIAMGWLDSSTDEDDGYDDDDEVTLSERSSFLSATSSRVTVTDSGPIEKVGSGGLLALLRSKAANKASKIEVRKQSRSAEITATKSLSPLTTESSRSPVMAAWDANKTALIGNTEDSNQNGNQSRRALYGAAGTTAAIGAVANVLPWAGSTEIGATKSSSRQNSGKYKAASASSPATMEKTVSPRALSPVMDTWEATKTAWTGGDTGKTPNQSSGTQNRRLLYGVAGTGALVGAVGSGLPMTKSADIATGSSRGEVQRSRSVPPVLREKRSLFRSLWKKNKGGFIDEVGDENRKILPSATTLSRSITYSSPTRRRKTQESITVLDPKPGKKQTPRQVKLNSAIMVYNGTGKEKDREEATYGSSKYVPSRTLVRQMQQDEGGSLVQNPVAIGSRRAQLYLPPSEYQATGGRSITTRVTTSGKSVKSRKSIATRKSDVTGYYTTSHETHRSGATRQTTGERSSSKRRTGSGRSVSTRRTEKTERSNATRKSVASKRRRSRVHEEDDVLGFLSPPSMEA